MSRPFSLSLSLSHLIPVPTHVASCPDHHNHQSLASFLDLTRPALSAIFFSSHLKVTSLSHLPHRLSLPRLLHAVRKQDGSWSCASSHYLSSTAAAPFQTVAIVLAEQPKRAVLLLYSHFVLHFALYRPFRTNQCQLSFDRNTSASN
jgi:hypothetical protein